MNYILPSTTILERLQAEADAAYERYLAQCRRPECLGERAKMQSGKFGAAELTAHKRAAAFLARHEAFSEAIRIMKSLALLSDDVIANPEYEKLGPSHDMNFIVHPVVAKTTQSVDGYPLCCDSEHGCHICMP